MNDRIRELKAKIRSAMKEQLKNMSFGEIVSLSEKIKEFLFSTKEWQEASLLFIYKATPNEVQTEHIIKEAFFCKKRVCVPAFNMKEKIYEIVLIDEKTQFKKGYYNIEEPLTLNFLKEDERIDVAIMPGIAFDKKGARLGRGGGYYDRLLKLKMCETARKIGLFFNFQEVEELPTTPLDVSLDLAITEKGIFRFNG